MGARDARIPPDGDGGDLLDGPVPPPRFPPNTQTPPSPKKLLRRILRIAGRSKCKTQLPHQMENASYPGASVVRRPTWSLVHGNQNAGLHAQSVIRCR